MTVRTGIVGCGQAAYKYHIPVLQELDTAELVSVSDVNESAMDEVDGVAKYTDFKEMIDDEDLDSIHITTPPTLRIPIVECATQNGISVFLEKPTAVTTEEVDRMIRIRDEHGIAVCCTQNMRFQPIMQRALNIVNDAVREVTAVDNVFSIPKDLSGEEQGQPWADDLPGGAIGEGTPHLIYTALAFTDHLEGEPEATVRWFDSDDHFDGVSVTGVDEGNRFVTALYLTRSHPMRRLTVHGTDGNMIVDFLESTITVDKDNESSTEKVPEQEGIIKRLGRKVLSDDESKRFGYGAGHYNLIKGYLKALETGGEMPVPLEEDRDVVAVIERIDEIQ